MIMDEVEIRLSRAEVGTLLACLRQTKLTTFPKLSCAGHEINALAGRLRSLLNERPV